MTDTMRERFEAWYAKQYPDPVPNYAADEERIIKDNRWHVWQAAQADARALVGDYLDFMKKYRVCLIAEHGDLDEKAKAVSVLDEKIAKAQAFMEGK